MTDTNTRNILVINAGSSSIKFMLFNMAGEQMIAKGIVERITLPGWKLKFVVDGREVVAEGPETLSHKMALQKVFDRLAADGGPVQRTSDLLAVGHRVVHGGEKFSDPAIITDDVKKAIRELFPLAPLHNPPNYEGITACEELLPGIRQVAVFDTAFHQTIRKRAFLYAIPYELYEQDGIRRYGFHGTSHRYVSLEAAKILGRENDPDLKLITCHLGNGCSVAAIHGRQWDDTSLGLTPLEGLVMGTRSGDIDPGVIFHLMRHKGMTLDQVDNLLNKKSGLYGLAGIGSGDMRDLIAASKADNERVRYAIHVYVYRLKKYIGAYTASLNGLDGLVFTAGVGENVPLIRAGACEGLEQLGIKIDLVRNEANLSVISAVDSKVTIMVIRTNEELMIARDTLEMVSAH